MHINITPKYMDISSDYEEIKFDTDDRPTLAAPEALVIGGEKAWYEFTIKEGDGDTRIGWGTTKFEVDCNVGTWSDGDGNVVGNCNNSWSISHYWQRKV